MSVNVSLEDEELKALIKAINLIEDLVNEDRADNFTEAELDCLAMLKENFDIVSKFSETFYSYVDRQENFDSSIEE